MLFAGKAARRLGRSLFHAMMIYQQKLESKQMLMTRLVNIGADIFAMAATCSRTLYKLKQEPQDHGAAELCDLFCNQAAARIRGHFSHLHRNYDRFANHIAEDTLSGKHSWLESDIIEPQG